jgi:DNA-binding beta-propeller fold protein YncE
LLFSVAAAVAVNELWDNLIQSRLLRRIWQTALVALLAINIITAVTALIGLIKTQRVPTPRPTLDGTAYLALGDVHEAAAFEWLNQRIAGIPVIAEAYGPSYGEFARVSMNTGLPTVLGWDYHVHQRGQEWSEINRRKEDLKTLYSSDQKEIISEILQRYHIALVYVGKLERREYLGGNLARFIQWSDLLIPVYQNAGVTVFAVKGQFTSGVPVTTIEEVPEVQVKANELVPQAEVGQLRQPRGIGIDSQGNAYVADFGNDRIQKFDRQLRFRASWGKKGNLPGQFNQPGDIFIETTHDTVYVADTWNHRVQVFNAEGEYLREWTRAFFGPRGITVSSDGKVYVVDTGNHRVSRFSKEGKEEMSWGSLGTEPGQFREPVGITTDTQGRVYVCDNGNARMQIFDRDGKFLSEFQVEGWSNKVFSEPHVIVTPGETIWVTVPLGGAVRAYDRKGNILYQIPSTKERRGSFQRPMGIAFQPTNNTLIVSDLENRLERIPIPEGVPR